MQRANSDHGSQPSLFRLVETGWAAELIDGVREGPAELRIVCPFIKERALDRLLELGPKNIRVITRFNLADFADGVSDIAALRKLLRARAAVRGIRNLHAKLYLFGDRRAIVTSANLTEAGLCHNPEFGVVTNDATAVRECRAYFDNLWSRGGGNLCREKLDVWDGKVKRHLVSGTRIFGLAVAMKHVPGRDDATPQDIDLRSWKESWPRYIRVHHAEFVAGTMENGVSLGGLMDTLGADSFASTQRNRERGSGNINPRRALMQQPAVKLSEKGRAWLSQRLQEAFEAHGKVPEADLRKLDQQALPADW